MNTTPIKELLFVVAMAATASASLAQGKLDVQWDKTTMVSKTTPTLQVVVNPPLRRGSSIHDQSFAALKNLGCDYVRYVPWLPYPRLGIAELSAPANGKTSWDFSVIDPITTDFLDATKGHSVILNFSTIPAWMFKTEKPVTYPDDPSAVYWNYTQGHDLVDTTCKQLGDYYGRLYGWYTNGGFTDEYGKYHSSGYHYSIPYWEVFNEIDYEHSPSPKQYCKEYDAVVTAIKKVSPSTKFVGLALAFETNPDWFEVFLNHNNHKAGIPLDMISYHFYGGNSEGQTIDDMQYTYFEQADNFVNRVRFIESIRKRLSPATKTTTDEIGTIYSNEDSIPYGYFGLSGALYAYTFLELTRLGIDVVGESQLVGYPTQYPSVSMIDWANGKPNTRYWVLKLIKDNIGPGDALVQTDLQGNYNNALSLQAFKTSKGNRLLIINKHNKNFKLTLPDSFKGGTISVADISTGDNEPVPVSITDTTIELKPFAVAIVIPGN